MQSGTTDNGALALASDLLFADMRPDAREGIPDCMKVDTQGNVYCGDSGGIHVLSPGGERLGIVVHGSRHHQCLLWRQRLEVGVFHHA